MNNYLNRISKRSQQIIKSFDGRKEIPFTELVLAIRSAGGMGAAIIESHKDILDEKFNKTLSLNDLVEEAFFSAIRMGHTYVGTEHLLLGGLIKCGYPDVPSVSSDVERSNSLPILLKQVKGTTKIAYLNAYGADLTRKYIFYPKENFVDREEVSKILKILLQKHGSNVLLLGEEGVDKDGLIDVLARKISYLDVPAYFMGSYVIDFNFQAYLSGTSSFGDAFDTSIKSLATEIEQLGSCIIVIKQMPNMLMPSLFRTFVETLNRSGAKLIIYSAADSEDLFYGFTPIAMEEPDQKTIKEILKSEASKLTHYFLIQIPPKIVEYAYNKANKEIKDQIFPQKGILLLDKACALALHRDTVIAKPIRTLMEKHVKLSMKVEDAFIKKDYDAAMKVTQSIKRLEKRVSGTSVASLSNKTRILTKDDIDGALKDFKNMSDVAEYKIGTKTLTDLERRIKQKVISQDKAVEVVAKALVRAQMGLRPKNKPIGNFLFLGPTGVGKTELAKVLAQEAFGDDSLIRLDMSDFSEKHTVARLVGSPPGYVGYGEGGELTTKISQKPQSVVLFDEIEKAHPEVLNILLQITEEGQLTDMRGESFDFSKAVVVLTSNLGTDTIHKRGIGYGGGDKSQKEVEDRVVQSVKSFLKPELLNRFDEIVIFRQLDKSDSRTILNLMLKEVYSNLAARGIKLKVGKDVKEHLLEKGFSKEFGARSLRRTVEKELLDRLAGHMLESQIKDKKARKASNAPLLRAVLANGSITVI